MGDDEEICMHTIQAVRIEKESGFEFLEEIDKLLSGETATLVLVGSLYLK